jgi:pimeloyl-ACP methyl ester carboxylesterase
MKATANAHRSDDFMMLDGSTRIAVTLALGAALGVGGCWNAVDTHCGGCVIVSERAPALPPLKPSTRAVVILVHGAFGFGDEWRGVVAAVRARPKTAMVAFAWGGPWTRKPSLAAEALLRVVQRAIDDAPAHAQILVIAHSAGGALTSFVGERLRVPAGRRVKILSIAAPEGMNLSPYRPEREVDTPLGFAIGGEQEPLGPIAPGVEYVEYATADAPAQAPPARPGVRRVYLGARVGHNESVGLAALPALHAL